MLDTLLKQLAEFACCLWLIYLVGILFFGRQQKQPAAESADPIAERKRICRAIGMPTGS